MRIGFFILTTIVSTAQFLLAAPGYGQGKAQKQISLDYANAPVESIFSAIEKKADVIIMYERTAAIRKQKATLSVNNVKVADVLDQLLENASLQWSIRGKFIRIEKKPDAAGKPEILFMTGNNPVIGVVKGPGGRPMEGATVSIRGSKKSTTTDAFGVFTIEAATGDVLQISFVGYETRTVTVTEDMIEKGASNIVGITEKVSDLDETVVVAYGTTTQRANTGSITVIKGEQIRNLPSMSFDKSLQGLVPGLVITRGSGQPGGNVSNFILHGIATGGDPSLGNPVRNPLIVIDGVPVSQSPSMGTAIVDDNDALISNPIAHLNPADIETVSVLKDASAIALYGSKASNGVILVTTKKGKKGKTRFSFGHRFDIANRADNGVQFLNQQQYIDLFVETFRNSNPDTTREQVIAKLKREFPTRADGSFYPQANWVDAVSNKAALTNSTNLSISGGKENSSFYVNMEHSAEEGVIKNTGYSRSSARINLSGQPESWIDYGLSTTFSYNTQEYPNSDVLRKSQFMSPLNPIYDESGNMIYSYKAGADFYNSAIAYETASPLVEVIHNINRNRAYHGLGSGFLNLKFLKHFTLATSLGFDFMMNENKVKYHPKLIYANSSGELMTGGRINLNNTRKTTVIVSNTLSFSKIFKNHSVSILLGQEAQKYDEMNTNAIGEGFANNPTLEDITGGMSYAIGGQTSGRTTSLSYFSRFNYGYKDKYYIQGSLRADGSSMFGASNRFGTFWSIGLGYILSDEFFLKDRFTWLDLLKLRGSFGPAGNSAAIQYYQRLTVLTASDFIGNPAVRVDYNGNSGIKWEQTFPWTAGLELQLLNNRISLTLDLYKRKTKNFIASVDVPYTVGDDKLSMNIGDMANRGLDLALSAYILRLKNFNWNISVNWNRNTNRLTKAFHPDTYINGTVNVVGQEYSSFRTAIWAGVDPQTGRPQWLDANGNKTSVYYNNPHNINNIIGKTQPSGTGSVMTGINYKGLSLSCMLYFSYGSTIGGGNIFQNDGTDPYLNQSIAALDHWRKPGDQSRNPRRLFFGAIGNASDFSTYPSTRGFFDGDFIRLNNVSLKYSFPHAVLRRLRLEHLSIFVQGSNLALWSKYSGSDPENISAFGGAGILYPQAKIYSTGIDLSF